MHPDTLSRRTVTFVNIAHALDHFVLLIYPTAVIAIAAERELAYASLIGLATGAFVAFGLFSLPMGWLPDGLGGAICWRSSSAAAGLRVWGFRRRLTGPASRSGFSCLECFQRSTIRSAGRCW